MLDKVSGHLEAITAVTNRWTSHCQPITAVISVDGAGHGRDSGSDSRWSPPGCLRAALTCFAHNFFASTRIKVIQKAKLKHFSSTFQWYL